MLRNYDADYVSRNPEEIPFRARRGAIIIINAMIGKPRNSTRFYLPSRARPPWEFLTDKDIARLETDIYTMLDRAREYMHASQRPQWCIFGNVSIVKTMAVLYEQLAWLRFAQEHKASGVIEASYETLEPADMALVKMFLQHELDYGLRE